MVIEKINSRLPKRENSLSKMLKNCEKRNKILNDTEGHYKERIEKAKHDLARAIFEFEDDCYDWTIVKAYYALHHAGNALLSKKKAMFSKDHLCLILALYNFKLIPKDIFNELVKINDKFSDTLSLDISFELRKISQYSVDEWKNISKADAKAILDLAKKFVKFAEEEIA